MAGFCFLSIRFEKVKRYAGNKAAPGAEFNVGLEVIAHKQIGLIVTEIATPIGFH